MAFAYPDDGSNLLFVVEQHTATIWSFPNERTTSDKKLFLELPDPINRGNEEGLLGLAFHPKYKENKQFFVYYSANDQGKRRSVVSRFRASSGDPRVADPASEERIWVSAEDPFENHNGGTIVFGPDGYLYITLGDGGAADDPMSSGQNPRDWFASILRIDVDHPADGKPYGIPGITPPGGPGSSLTGLPRSTASACATCGNSASTARPASSGRATSARTSGRWSTASRTAATTAGASRKDFTRSSPSGDSGPMPPPRSSRRSSSIPTPPPATAPTAACRITGGYVYRGKKIPALVGVYVYGDFDSGRIWGLRYENGKLIANGELIDLKTRPQAEHRVVRRRPAGRALHPGVRRPDSRAGAAVSHDRGLAHPFALTPPLQGREEYAWPQWLPLCYAEIAAAASRALERLTKLPPQVVGVFDPDRDPDHAGGDSLTGQLLVVLPAMARRGGMAQRRLHVAQAGSERNLGEVPDE